MSASSFTIKGTDGNSAAIDHAACAAVPADGQIADVSAVAPKRTGRAVRLSALLSRLPDTAGGDWVNVASGDGFFASVPASEVLYRAVVIYEDGGKPLEHGGPFRLLIPGFADPCANVKQLASVALSRQKGLDTRPKSEQEHAALHTHDHAPDCDCGRH
jgi:hypothetical protein